MNWYLKVVRDNYANFSGRASRTEYWMFVLLNTVFTTVLGVDIFITGGLIFGVYQLAMIIPALAVTVRRLHDVDKSGWCLLLAVVPVIQIILLVWQLTGGTPGDNKYGPSPREIDEPAPAAEDEAGKAESEETDEEA